MKAYLILTILWLAATGNDVMGNILSPDLSLHSENLVRMFRDYLMDVDIHRDRRSLQFGMEGDLSRMDRQTQSSQTVQNFALWYDPSSGMRMCETNEKLMVTKCLDVNGNCKYLNTSLGVCTNPKAAQTLGCLKTCNLCNDPCVLGRTKCHVNADCISNNGNVKCQCKPDYEGDGINKCQKDVDECKLGTHNCTKTQICENRVGYFLCADSVKEKTPKVQCNNGYQVQNGSCVDVDECKTNQDQCHALAACINTVGGYRCQCRDGYLGNGKVCFDVNECKMSTCSKWATCVNTPGSFKCTCNKGFSGNGITCKDNNECNVRGQCSAYAMCTNTIGSYSCTCKKGYAGSGKYCNDINECAKRSLNTCDLARSKCQNLRGSYRCLCNAGYVMKGGKCSLKIIKVAQVRRKWGRWGIRWG